MIRTTELALCSSIDACLEWNQSKHVKHVDTALNETCRLITGCLKATPLKNIYPLAGITPPEIRRYVTTCIKRTKQTTDLMHPMNGYFESRRRFKSRISLITKTNVIQDSLDQIRLRKWREELGAETPVPPDERLLGGNQPWPIWKTINRLRAGVFKTRDNMIKWGYHEGPDTCECGKRQSDEHLIKCALATPGCTINDLVIANVNAISIATYWLK